MGDWEGELYRAEVEKAGEGKAEAGVPMQAARVEQRGGGCRTEMGLGIGFCMVVLGKHIRGKKAGAATVAREVLAFWAAVEMGRGGGKRGFMGDRWAARQGRGGATDGHKDEDAWSVAGRDPLNKAKLLEARAAGIREEFIPAPLAPNRFEALAEEDEVDNSQADPLDNLGHHLWWGRGADD